jgi:hypothetical protein
MFLLLACTASTPDDTGNGVVDTSDNATDTGETAWDTAMELNGSWPAEEVPLPTFTASNMDGTARGPEHLTGQVTVMWFYPYADTFG